MSKYHYCSLAALTILFPITARAEVVINELLGSTSGDDREYIELFNRGAAPVDIGSWRVAFYDSDSGSAFGGLDGSSPYVIPEGVELQPGDHYLLANALAQNEFSVTADLVLPANAIENSSYTAILEDANGAAVNAIFVTDGGSTDQANQAGLPVAAETSIGPDGTFLPAGFSRDGDGADTFSILPFTLTPLSAYTPTAQDTAVGDVVINELLGSTTGDDREYVELFNRGNAPLDISGWQIFLYDSDAGASFGGLDGASPYTVPAGVVLAAGDHYLLANALAEGEFGVAADLTLPANAVENSSYTAILRRADGTLADSAFVTDGGIGDAANDAGTPLAANATIGPDGTFLPAGCTRAPDGANSFTLLPFNLAPLSAFTPTALQGGGTGADCSDPVTLISSIQGTGPTSPLLGQQQAVRAVVVGDFQGPTAMRGFFVQEEASDQDNDTNTSEGLFVFSPNAIDVVVGDLVHVVGTVSEFNANTQLSSIASLIKCATATVPAPVVVSLPESLDGELERYENMSVSIATSTNAMTVAQNFFLGRYGQMTLSSPDDSGAAARLFQPTNQHRPASVEALAEAASNSRRLLVLDDGFEVNALGDNPAIVPYLGVPPPAVIRGGDRVENLVGILDQGRINSAATPVADYRLQPTITPLFVAQNPRAETPDQQQELPGRLHVASFNVLNYFTTLDQTGAQCFGPDANPRANCRGAESATEFDRQRDKIVAALMAMNADIVGLVEIQNEFGPSGAVANLVDALNAAIGSEQYTWIDPGVQHIGSDAIAVALIYRNNSVEAIGTPAILDSSVDPTFIDTRNRPALAQAFRERATGEALTVVVNHLKSKGSDCLPDDPDLGDGQGNCNQTRRAAAVALAQWLATDPTGSNDSDVLILGDLNAYAKEDPIFTLEQAGYRNLIAAFNGANAYSFTFDGLLGYLDHALANRALAPQVRGAVTWHINTDEPAVIDYDENFNPPGYYTANVFRSSDHDPVLVGLDLGDGNVIRGTPRRDTLVGTDGNDVILGLGGRDYLTGGDGADLFRYFRAREGSDFIFDFVVDEDLLDLRPLIQQLAVVGDPVAQRVILTLPYQNGVMILVDADGSTGPTRPVLLTILRDVDPATPVSSLALLR